MDRSDDGLQVLASQRLQPARPERGLDEEGAYFQRNSKLIPELDEVHERWNGDLHTRPNEQAKPM